MVSPMMSVTSGSPSSSSSMKAASSAPRFDLDFFNLAHGARAFGRSRLLALLLGLGVFERNKFGIRGLWHDGFGLRYRRRRRPCDRCRRFRPRARWRRNDDRNDLAGIGRNHRRLAEIVELAAGFRTDALGAEISFRHSRVPRNVDKSVFHLASCNVPVNSAGAPGRGQNRPDDGPCKRVVGRRNR